MITDMIDMIDVLRILKPLILGNKLAAKIIGKDGVFSGKMK